MATLEHSFDSHEPVATIQTDITGAETATLDETDYSETDNGDGTYTYTAQYTANTDGDYTFTITTADTSAGDPATWGGQAVTHTLQSVQVIDSFEDQDFVEYHDNGDGTNLTTGTTFVTDGSYGMEITRNGAKDQIISLKGDGLNYYPKPDDTWRFDYRAESADTLFYHGFLLQDYTTAPPGFCVTIEPANSQLRLWKDWNTTQLDSAAVTINTATHYIPEVSINGADGTITCRLLDSAESELASVTATDADAATGGAYDANYGISWSQNDTASANGLTYAEYARQVA